MTSSKLITLQRCPTYSNQVLTSGDSGQCTLVFDNNMGDTTPQTARNLAMELPDWSRSYLGVQKANIYSVSWKRPQGHQGQGDS
ncbi:hypothetical protein E2C01_034414 [Portunus trituberculatus]|uniref:Uncharacterized protein n=1 Tax=Portunus trituberculatus TaxID=210409 RepID=A0A5B7F2T0_PORTR|nr:hypothetical protein [Portunus trituberculatus]